MPYLIGLTGNIAAGKSAVAGMLVELGADLIDADRVAHEVMRPGTEEWAALRARFGDAVLDADGAIDRARLGEQVFGNPAALRDLESILHPSVRARIRERIRASAARVVVVEAIKLLEGGLYRELDSVWVVTAPREVRLRRLVEQRGLRPPQAAARIDAQTPEVEKARRADVVIDGGTDLATTRQQVLSAWDDIVRGIAPQRRGEERA
jgi:dephospho-CoA kinase